MLVDIIPTIKDFSAPKIYGKTVIVLDIFRCTSTVVTALANGCHKIVPVSDYEEALSLAKKLDRESCMVAGEVYGTKPPDFDLGNSPLEFTPETIAGKTVILLTTNGTKAIKHSKPAKNVLIGSFLNLNAVCSRALGFQKDITIICSGTRGNIALEDVLAAGCHVAELVEHCQEIRLSELSKTFYFLYEYFKGDLTHLLSAARSGVRLQKHGCEDDIGFCLQKDRFRVVPVFKYNSIKLSQSIDLHILNR